MDERVKEDKDILQIMDFDTLKNNYTAFEDSLFQNKASDKRVNFQKNIVLAAGWGLSNSGKMVQLTIGQSASQSDETADKTEESAKENVAVMKWGMNVRSEPTTKTEKNIVAALKKGDTITILSKADDDGWIKISSTDEDGNVISGYMQSVYDGETVYTMK